MNKRKKEQMNEHKKERRLLSKRERKKTKRPINTKYSLSFLFGTFVIKIILLLSVCMTNKWCE